MWRRAIGVSENDWFPDLSAVSRRPIVPPVEVAVVVRMTIAADKDVTRCVRSDGEVYRSLSAGVEVDLGLDRGNHRDEDVWRVGLWRERVAGDQPQGVAGVNRVFDGGDRVGAVVEARSRHGDAVADPETVVAPVVKVETCNGVRVGVAKGQLRVASER